MKTLLLSLLLITLAGCKSTTELPAVSGFDATRYMGVWYEAARYPHRFEKGMSSVSATYSLNDDGTIRVLNRGYVDAKWKEIEGIAKLKGSKDDGWLKVCFFKPFYADYKIIYLDAAYRTAIVTGPSYGYLWILTRDPAVPDADLKALISKAKKFGFEEEKIIRVDQSNHPF